MYLFRFKRSVSSSPKIRTKDKEGSEGICAGEVRKADKDVSAVD